MKDKKCGENGDGFIAEVVWLVPEPDKGKMVWETSPDVVRGDNYENK